MIHTTVTSLKRCSHCARHRTTSYDVVRCRLTPTRHDNLHVKVVGRHQMISDDTGQHRPLSLSRPMSCAVWTPLYGANVVDGKRRVKRQAWVFLRCSGLMNFVDHKNSHTVSQVDLFVCSKYRPIQFMSSSSVTCWGVWVLNGTRTLRTQNTSDLQFGAEVSRSSLSADLSCVTSFSKLFWTEMLSGTEISNHQYLCSRLDTLYGRTDVGLKCQVITVIIKV